MDNLWERAVKTVDLINSNLFNILWLNGKPAWGTRDETEQNGCLEHLCDLYMSLEAFLSHCYLTE